MWVRVPPPVLSNHAVFGSVQKQRFFCAFVGTLSDGNHEILLFRDFHDNKLVASSQTSHLSTCQFVVE